MSTNPNISALIPLYNNEQFIGEAIESVLRQTLPVSEIIVVDDGSTDDSIVSIPSSPLIKVLARPHLGLAATLNHAISHATGNFIAFLDSDDRWLPTKLEKQYHSLQNNPEGELCFCLARQFHHPPSTSDNTPQVLNGVAKSGFLVSHSNLIKVGLFQEDNRRGHDFLDWYARAHELGLRSHIVPEVLYERRIHANNKGIRQHSLQRASYFAALKASLDRRRSTSS